MVEKVVCLTSGGIDSPYAIYRTSKRFEVLPLHFCLYPKSTKENTLKAMKALQNLQEKIGFEEAIIFPWAGILEEITTRVKESYTCVVCKKSMMLTAQEICEEKSADGIVTGESLGQKASQTIENISAISSDIEIPVLRPLIGMNKEEIINLSKEKGLFRTDHAGSCPAVPANPQTKAKLEEVNQELEKIKLEEYIEENKDMVMNLEDINEDISKYFSKLEKKR